MFATEAPGAKNNLTQNWVISHSATYVLLKPHHPAAAVNDKMPAFLAAHANPRFKDDITFHLEPIRDIHLHSDAVFTPEPTGNITYVYFFMGIAFLTLIIASFNFINLSTARSIRRAREVGMRKVMGAHRGKLIGQFIGESLLLSFIAFLFSLLLIELLLPTFNALTDRTLGFLTPADPLVLFIYAGIFVLTGILAGSYPALFISSFQPITALKGEVDKQMGKGLRLRKVLVVAQFTVTIALIASAMIVYLQLQYWRNQPLGFHKDHVLTVPLFSSNMNNIFSGMTQETHNRLDAFKNEITTHHSVAAMTLSSHLPGVSMVVRSVVPEGFTEEDNLFIGGIAVDFNFIETYGLEVIEGRDFSKEHGSDQQDAFIINRKAVEIFGWNDPADAIGKSITREGKSGTIIGVIKDFHHRNLRMSINGYLLDVNPYLFSTVSIRISGQNVPETVEYLNEKWTEYFPGKAFDYTFLDGQIEALYGNEERLARAVGYFSLLAVLISSLGLYGLILLAAEQRTKEIGVRKVLGASVSHILYLLTREFTILIAAAFVIAVPVVYFTMNKWLIDFAYRIDISWIIFAVAGGLVMLIALITLSIQAAKAALSNPVEALRYE
jgi:putative ABC transport system permease protein